jgi:hypothetical protein
VNYAKDVLIHVIVTLLVSGCNFKPEIVVAKNSVPIRPQGRLWHVPGGFPVSAKVCTMVSLRRTPFVFIEKNNM